MAAGLRQVAALPDPVGEVLRRLGAARTACASSQVRVPLGVVGDHLREPPQRHQRRRRRCASSRATPPSCAARRGRSRRTSPSPACCARRWPRPACPRTPSCSSRTPPASRAVEFMRQRGVDRLPHPPRRAVAHRLDPRARHGALRDRRRRQLPRLRRRVGRPRHGRRHRGQRQDAAPVGVQRRRDRWSCTTSVADAFLPRRRRAPLDGVELVGDDAHAGAGARMRRGRPTTTTRSRVPRPEAGGAGRADSLDDAIDHVNRYGTGHSRGHRHRRPARAPTASPPRSTPPPCWSTRRPGSSTARSSASAPRSASPPRSCTPAARWGCASSPRRSTSCEGDGQIRG